MDTTNFALDPKKMIPEFQARIKSAESCEDMLMASFAFVQFHGGFSNSPETRAKFIKLIDNLPSKVA